MAHPMVEQLRFTRREWLRALDGVTPEEAVRSFAPINCLSWMVGHLASQEQRYWLITPQGKTVAEVVNTCASGQPASTPSLDEMWAGWHAVTQASDAYLDTFTDDTLNTHFMVDGQPHRENVGTMLYRVIYHYWFHLGEAQAVRQLLGHTELPSFVGKIPPYGQGQATTHG